MKLLKRYLWLFRRYQWNLVEILNAETKTFALGYEIQGDVKQDVFGISYVLQHHQVIQVNQR